MSSEPGPTLSVCDVAARLRGRVDDALPAASLHALCYYSLAWSLAHCGQPLFPESFHAGDHGPLCPDLDAGTDGDPQRMDAAQRMLVDAVIDAHSAQPAERIAQMVRCDDPWRQARAQTPDGAAPVISQRAIKRHYAKRLVRGEAPPQVLAALRSAPQPQQWSMADPHARAQALDRQMLRWAGVNRRLADR
ncbi:hypothetical protein [Kocuria palustris]|uniref:Panacea domain-containing protein n=1 Tax=Kocuria palustris TaxID=71999 RepID=UPI0028CFF2BF|nr:hypothetical protein [Kocuria palustris]